ncbi:penicillin acylase family protein [Chitinivorax sp. B]|uniref:penicillin acylase family protein n=1 Tax=Chitinivorax sp. B TaxID=2502235 RepID=UPI0010F849A5|nr:penicillin acylase family protein [Chitinivorax sp. B]
MLSYSLPVRLRTVAIAVGLMCSGLTACTSFLESHFAEPPHPAEMRLLGLAQPVSVRRDELGIPLIEAQSMNDLAYAMGYVAAEDRYSQMVGFKMIAQGRLAEMVGEPALDIDRYMRTLNLRRSAQILWDGTSPETRQLLTRYAAGVNAWRASRPLPADMQLSSTNPEPWQPKDSMAVMALINFGLAQNLQEEVSFLRMAQQVGVEKAAWLTPVYPDEPIPLDEARKLAGLDLNAVQPAVKQLLGTLASLDQVTGHNLAASNNWAVGPSRTKLGASIVANDTHLLLSQPATWHYIHAKAPGLDVAGVAVAGLPGIVAGFNGKVAWGMTMVMADNQDIFLEQLKAVDGKLHYLYQGQWLPCVAREETFMLKGGKTVKETIYETRHGALLNAALYHVPKSDLLARQVRTGYGLALQTSAFEPDATLDAFLAINRANNAEEARAVLRQVRAIELNVAYGDRANIGWQVTGRYPVRSKGRGQLPSPGWNGEYDWQGYVSPDQLPASFNPAAGFLTTANNRTVDASYPHHLTSSWYYPERVGRAMELLKNDAQHTTAASQAMQLDRTSLLAKELAAWLGKHDLTGAATRLSPEQQQAVQWAKTKLIAFDGSMAPESADAALYGMFIYHLARDTFGDELEVGSEAWHAFVRVNDANYGAVDDHLHGREDSPFWDDILTPPTETKPDIIARALAHAVESMKQRQGNDPANWSWGKLHTYSWQTEATKLAPHLGWLERMALSFARDYLDRGPYPAGGDHSTLNVAAYPAGEHFETWMVPAMRMVVDFGLDEPMQFVNLSGQSSNPGSVHYDDGIHWWLQGKYQTMPFKQQHIDRLYGPPIQLLPGR